MARKDPYSMSAPHYECVGCGRRQSGGEHPGTCPHCGSVVRNIAVPRE